MPARPKTNTQKKDSNNISTISSKFVWDSEKKSWKLKRKMSKQVKVVLEKSPLTELKTAVVRLKKCPISEMKTAVVKLKRLAMPKLRGKLLEKNPETESKQVMVALEKSPLTELKTAAVQLEKCLISEMKTAVVKLKRLEMPKLKGKSLEKNPRTESRTYPSRIDCSRKPLLSESERNAIKLMILENQEASNLSYNYLPKKLFNEKLKGLPDYEKRRLTNIREKKTMFDNLKKNSLILSASKSERLKMFSIPKRVRPKQVRRKRIPKNSAWNRCQRNF